MGKIETYENLFFRDAILSLIHQNNKTTMAFSVFVTIFKLHLFNYISIKAATGKIQKKEATKKLSNQYV